MRTLRNILAAAFLTILFTVPAGRPVSAAFTPLASRTGFFFDTFITISLYDTADEKILDDCFDKMAYYESKFSRTLEGSDIWNINHAGGEKVTVADETAQLIEKALEYCEISGGAFDITIAPVTDLWDFHAEGEHTIPDEEILSEALSHVDYRNVNVDGNEVWIFDPDAAIDLGAIAKGYISDGAAELIRDAGCKSALIDLGGNIYAVGTRPDGTPFNIGVRKPFGESMTDIIDVVPSQDSCVITSGVYERYFEKDGKLYHHILDPKTGFGTTNGLISVSIAAASGTDGDALSTTCFLMGKEKGMELIETLEGTEALFIDENMELYSSSGWQGRQ